MSTVLLRLRVFQNQGSFVFKSLDLLFTYIIVFKKVSASHWCHLFPWCLVIFKHFLKWFIWLPNNWFQLMQGILSFWISKSFLFSSSLSELHSCIIYLKFVLFSKRDTFIHFITLSVFMNLRPVWRIHKLIVKERTDKSVLIIMIKTV